MWEENSHCWVRHFVVVVFVVDFYIYCAGSQYLVILIIEGRITADSL